MANDGENVGTSALAPTGFMKPGTTDAISVFASESNFSSGQRIAKALASSNLMPKDFQNNLPNVLIAMELASRIGASVLMVAQNLDVIHGRPSWRASFLIACVNNSGRFTPLRFRFQGTEGSLDWGCRAVARDRETGEECVGTLITIKMAQAEGWSTKSGSKWKTLPELMLQYRAAAFWARVFAPELSLGMSTAEELRDVYGNDGRGGGSELPAQLTPAGAKALEMVLGVQPESAAPVDAEIVPEEAPEPVAEKKPAPPSGLVFGQGYVVAELRGKPLETASMAQIAAYQQYLQDILDDASKARSHKAVGAHKEQVDTYLDQIRAEEAMGGATDGDEEAA
jgi:hypothetical protein